MEDDVADDRLLSDSISTYASTISNVLLFDQASPNYTTVLSSQIPVTYQSNGTSEGRSLLSSWQSCFSCWRWA